MKTSSFLLGNLRWLVLLLACAGPGIELRAQLAHPTIAAVTTEGTNVVITVQVPPGLRRITLESRERVGPGAWEPRAVQRVDAAGGTITFRLAQSRSVELLRIRAEAQEPLPASFYTGVTEFDGETSAGGISYPPYTRTDVLSGVPNTPAAPEAAGTRSVVESDIWRIRGKTLYFFNTLRGLQIIDITQPDAAFIRGTLALPAVGEDMYLLGDRHIILLARKGCSGSESEVIVTTETAGLPVVVARLPVNGNITESRLVGTALYVASQAYRAQSGTSNTVWEWGTQVSAFDLSDPAKPAVRNTLWFSGYGNAVTATDRLLFVSTQDPRNWWQSIVYSIDIANPDGTMRAYETIRTAGRVPDKFKLRWDGSVLTTISEDWRPTTGRRLTTMLETFRLPDPRSMSPLGFAKLGELELGRGEQLHATRFDGNRAYVVTFFRIDPLWVVDLSNPANPRIAGSVDVPGWSTYIEPLGDRLVTIGVETNRAAVSLFDVANPAAPALLSRVTLGRNYSWSEANWDEKAFKVLPDAGLILVPFSGDTTNGYASRVQLVDLGRNSLAARGVIEHQFQPRRATLEGDRILSLSGWELLSVDASDRDRPLVRGNLALAWTVDRVFLHNDFLLQLSSASGWGLQASAPALRVAHADTPDTILAQRALGELPLLGAAKRGSLLYLAQGQGGGWPYPIVPLDNTVSGSEPRPRAKLTLTALDLSALPAIRIAGQVESAVGDATLGGELQAVWPKEETLVWVGGGSTYWWGCWDCLAPLPADAMSLRWWPGPIWNSGGGNLIAYDVSDAGAPRLASVVNLSSSNWFSFSKAFTADGKIFLSHQASRFVPDPIQPATTGSTTSDSAGTTAGDMMIGLPPLDYQPVGKWVTRHYLDVVDYADATDPLVRKSVNIPGTLAGVSHNGGILYTRGYHWSKDGWTDWVEYLDASAYDGTKAHLVDSLRLSNSWSQPVLVTGTNIFLGRSSIGSSGVVRLEAGALEPSLVTADTSPVLETWFLSEAGKFNRSGLARLGSAPGGLADFDGLLAVQQSDNRVTLFDARNGVALRETGNKRVEGCLWFDLSKTDGTLARGLWLPLGAYGVTSVPASP